MKWPPADCWFTPLSLRPDGPGQNPLLLRTCDNLIRYNSFNRGVRHACDKDGERKMAKTTPKAKNGAFMKPMQPSEHLAKIVGTEPLPRSEVTKRFGRTLRSTNFRIQRT